MVTGLRFQIRYPDGRTEQLLVDSERAMLGSGAHCEIRLPPEHAGVEHVLVTKAGEVIQARAMTLNPSPTINGVSFTEAPLFADAVLAVGAVQIIVSPAAGTANEDAVVKKKLEKTSPIAYVAAIVAIPLGVYFLVDDKPRDAAGPAPKDIPAL